MNELYLLREKIDNIDKQIIKLFEERMNLVFEIGKFKEKNNMPILNSKREEEVINKNISILKNKDLESLAKSFLQNMMSLSRGYQSRKY